VNYFAGGDFGRINVAIISTHGDFLANAGSLWKYSSGCPASSEIESTRRNLESSEG
jgi:hypothetical protein